MGNGIKLNELRPLLKECYVYEGERNIVIEEQKSKTQVVLPKEHQHVLNLLNGRNSIKDISSILYEKQGKVSFHSIIATIKLLNEAHLLEGVSDEFADIQEEKSPHEQKTSILNRPLLEVGLLGKIEFNFHNDWVFFGSLVILLAIFLFNHKIFTELDLSVFLKSSSGHNEALLRTIIICSVLMTLKAAVQACMLLFSVGNFYGPYFRVYPYTIALGINDNSIYSHLKKSVLIAYGVTSSLLYLICAAGLALINPLKNYHNDIVVFSVLLTFIEMNPYRRSDLTKLFYFFYGETHLKSVLPYLKNCTLAGLWKDTGAKLSDEIRYITYSVLAMGWAIGFTLFSFELVLKSFPGIFYEIQFGRTHSKYGAVLVMSVLLFITGHLLIDLFHTIIKNIISPLAPLMKFQSSSREYSHEDITLLSVRNELKKHMLFNQFSESAVDFLVRNSSIRMLKKGSHLIVQGDVGRDVYFLISGRVDVTVKEGTGRIKHIVTMGPNSVIGEMAVIEKNRRSANVTANEDIVYLEMPQKAFALLMAEEDYKHDFDKLMNRIEISRFVASADLFKNFPPEVMNLFVEAGDLVLFPKGHNVVVEGELDKTFYLLIKGKVDVYKHNEKVAELGQGNFFGEVALIANVPRTASVKTTEDCLFLYIEDKKFWDILSQNIELAMYIESVGRHRMSEAA